MQIFPEPEHDFFLTSDDFSLITKALVHLAECECAEVEELVRIFPLTAKIEALSFSELDDMAKTWNEKGIEE